MPLISGASPVLGFPIHQDMQILNFFIPWCIGLTRSGWHTKSDIHFYRLTGVWHTVFAPDKLLRSRWTVIPATHAWLRVSMVKYPVLLAVWRFKKGIMSGSVYFILRRLFKNGFGGFYPGMLIKQVAVSVSQQHAKGVVIGPAAAGRVNQENFGTFIDVNMRRVTWVMQVTVLFPGICRLGYFYAFTALRNIQKQT